MSLLLLLCQRCCCCTATLPVTTTYTPVPENAAVGDDDCDTYIDLEVLKEGEFLNDTIIEFYLRYLQREKLAAPARDRCHFFNSFFFTRLISKQGTTITPSNAYHT